MGTAHPATLQPARSHHIHHMNLAHTYEELTCSHWQAQPLSHSSRLHPWHSCPAAHRLEALGSSHQAADWDQNLGVGQDAATSSSPKLLHTARFVPCSSAAHPLVYLKVTITFPSTVCSWKSPNTTNAQREISDRDGCRKEARQMQAGTKRKSSGLSNRRGKETSQNGRKVYMESSPHRTLSITCNAPKLHISL